LPTCHVPFARLCQVVCFSSFALLRGVRTPTVQYILILSRDWAVLVSMARPACENTTCVCVFDPGRCHNFDTVLSFLSWMLPCLFCWPHASRGGRPGRACSGIAVPHAVRPHSGRWIQEGSGSHHGDDIRAVPAWGRRHLQPPVAGAAGVAPWASAYSAPDGDGEGWATGQGDVAAAVCVRDRRAPPTAEEWVRSLLLAKQGVAR